MEISKNSKITIQKVNTGKKSLEITNGNKNNTLANNNNNNKHANDDQRSIINNRKNKSNSNIPVSFMYYFK